jgi:hypothetical protein
VTAVIATFYQATGEDHPPTTSPPATTVTVPAISSLDREVKETQRELKELRKQVRGLEEPSSAGRLTATVGRLDRTMTQLGSDVSAIRKAILEDPAKAVELPLLKKDIDAAKAANTAAIASVEQDVERQYDLMKFVVGTFAFGFLALVIQAVASWRKGSSS